MLSLLLIFFLALLLAGAVALLVTHPWSTPTPSPTPPSPPTPSPTPPSPPGTFDFEQLSAALQVPSSDKKGGVLVHMFTLQQAKDLLYPKEGGRFELQANSDFVTDCAQPLRPTCSAWTYLRLDLMPVIFSKPTSDLTGPTAAYGTPICGIILDADAVLAADFVTNMGVLDSNTDARVCCANNGQSDVWNLFKSLEGGANRYGNIKENFGGYIDNTCAHECTQSDKNAQKLCKIKNSGGSPNVMALGCQGCKASTSGSGPGIPGNWGTDYCEGVPMSKPGDVSLESKCVTCQKSNMCYPYETAPPSATQLKPKTAFWAPYLIEENNMGQLIGTEANGFKNLFSTEDGRLHHTWDIASIMCKFRKEDWDVWIKALKLYYSAYHDAYPPPKSSPFVMKEYAPPVTSWSTKSQNFLNFSLANPVACTYNENEVNFYIYPKDALTDAAKAAAEKQSQDFRDAVRGFFYVNRTCPQFFQSLEGIQSKMSWSDETPPTIYSGAMDRCYGFMCNGSADQKSCKKLVDEEQGVIDQAADVMQALAHAFNNEYRQGKEKVAVFTYEGQNNTFLDYATLDKLKTQGTLAPSDFFKPAPPASTNQVATSLPLMQGRARKTWPPQQPR